MLVILNFFSVLALEILSTVASLSEQNSDYSKKFGQQVIDCITTLKSAQEWMMSRIIRDFGGKDKLGNLMKVHGISELKVRYKSTQYPYSQEKSGGTLFLRNVKESNTIK